MGALTTNPRGAHAERQQRLQAANRNPGRGALASDPNKIIATLEQRATQGKLGKNDQQRLDRLKAQQAQTPAPPTGGAASVSPTDPFQEATTGANNAMNQAFGYMQSQGQFNPGDYGQMRQQATDYAMNEFNRQNQGRFQQEDAQFEQQMAEQGIDPTSEKYRTMQQNRMLDRNNAIQGAQNNAFQMGQGEQAQAYGQQYNTWQAPMQQINALSPFYGYQNQNQQNQLDRDFTAQQTQGGYDFQREMAKLQQKYNLQLQNNAPRGGGGGGGGLTYDQQLGMLDRQFYNNMVLAGMQNGQQVPYPGAAGGIAQGVAGGVGVGLGAGLR